MKSQISNYPGREKNSIHQGVPAAITSTGSYRPLTNSRPGLRRKELPLVAISRALVGIGRKKGASPSAINKLFCVGATFRDADGLILAAVGSRSVSPGSRWKVLVTPGNWWFKIFVWFVYFMVDEEWLLKTWNLAFQILRLWSTRDEGFSDLADSAEDTAEVCSPSPDRSRRD